MLATESLFRRWNFKTENTTLVPVPGPPAPPEDRKLVFLAQPLPRGWHLLGSVAVWASGRAVASAPTAGSDWPAVNLAQWLLA